MNTKIQQIFHWPLKCFPEIVNAVKVPFDDCGFTKNYCSGTHHALHLYEYCGRILLDDNEYKITPGIMSITPQFTNARYDLPASGYHYCIHFCPGFTSGNGNIDFPLVFSSGNRHQETVLRFMKIIGMLMYSRLDSVEQTKIGMEFQQFLLWLSTIIQDKNEESDSGNPGVARVVALIEERLTEKINIPELAKEAKISQNYLAGLFRKQFGMTIPHYILLRRLEYAKTLLSISDMKIKEIAYQSGLPDPQYFNKQFRRIVGISPSEFRKVMTN